MMNIQDVIDVHDGDNLFEIITLMNTSAKKKAPSRGYAWRFGLVAPRGAVDGGAGGN